jgi:hypothetical protein
MSINDVESPTVYVIAGPNGAGKTTFSAEFLPDFVNCREFLNADLIAAGLSPFAPETQNLRAGRLLLTRIKELTKARQDFGFETTLAGHGYIPKHSSHRPLSLKKKGANSKCSIPISLNKSNEMWRYNSMNEKKVQDMPLSSKADAAFRQAAKRVIQRAIQTGTPVVIWEEGHVKEIPYDHFGITKAPMELREPRP